MNNQPSFKPPDQPPLVYSNEPPPAYWNGNVNGQQYLYPQQQQWQPMPIQAQPSPSTYFGHQPGQFGSDFELLPLPTSMPGPAYYQLGDLQSSVENELGRCNHLFFNSAGRIDEAMSLIQIQDGSGRTIYNVQVQATARLVSANSQNVQMAHGAVYTICNHNGQQVMRVQQETSSMHASMLGRSLGFVQNEDMCSTSFTACSTSGGSAFHIAGNQSCCLGWTPCCATPHFRIKANGEEIGSMKSNGNACGLSFPQDLDINSKALLMTAGIMIYIGYFGKTGCGSSGARGKACTWICSCLGLNLFLFLVPIVVIVLIIL